MAAQSHATIAAARINAPIEWDVQPKFVVQDLREFQYDEVINLIKRHYLVEEPMCKSIQLLDDDDSVNTYLELVRTWMKDTTSLVAVSKKSGRVVGVAVTRINDEANLTNTFSRIQLYEGEAIETIMQLKSDLIKQANAYKVIGADRYLRIYILSVHPSYKKKNVGNSLLRACTRVAADMNIQAVAGIFTSNENQTIAADEGFKLHAEIRYNNWLIDDEVVFEDPGIGNYSAAFMYKLTSEEEPVADEEEKEENK